MTLAEAIFLTIWVISSILIASYLFLKHSFFRRSSAIVVLFLSFVLLVFLHNFIDALFVSMFGYVNKEEPVFFIGAVFNFGILAVLFLLQIIQTIKNLLNRVLKTTP